MKNVLVFGMSSNLGGIEVYLKNLVIYSKNVHYCFVTEDEKPCYKAELEKYGVEFVCSGSRRKNFLKYYYNLIKIMIQKKTFPIVYVNLSNCSLIAPLCAGKLCGKKIICHAHNAGFEGKFNSRIFDLLNKKLVKRIGDVFCACSYQAGMWMFGKKIADNKLVVINNGLQLQKYRFDVKIRNTYRRVFGVLENTILIGNIGRCEKPKNQIFLIDIFQEYLKINSNAKLIIVGDGSLYGELVRYVDIKNLRGHVIFAGKREDVPSLLMSMDYFVFPSLYEGLGIGLIEAQASGLPVLCTDTIPQEVNVRNNVFRMPLQASACAWADKLSKIPVKISERKKGYSEIKSGGFDMEDSVKMWESLLE